MEYFKSCVEQLIKETARQCGFASTDDVVRCRTCSALLFTTNPAFRMISAPGEMDHLIEEGERSGDPLDAEEVFAELRAIREAAGRKRG